MPKQYTVQVNDLTAQPVITAAGRHWFKQEARTVHEGDPCLPELMACEFLDVVEVKPPTRRGRKPKAPAREASDETD